MSTSFFSPTADPRHRLHSTPKKSAHLNLSTDVLDAAKALNLDLSQVCDDYLRHLLQTQHQHNWRNEYGAP